MRRVLDGTKACRGAIRSPAERAVEPPAANSRPASGPATKRVGLVKRQRLMCSPLETGIDRLAPDPGSQSATRPTTAFSKELRF